MAVDRMEANILARSAVTIRTKDSFQTGIGENDELPSHHEAPQGSQDHLLGDWCGMRLPRPRRAVR